MFAIVHDEYKYIFYIIYKSETGSLNGCDSREIQSIYLVSIFQKIKLTEGLHEELSHSLHSINPLKMNEIKRIPDLALHLTIKIGAHGN